MFQEDHGNFYKSVQTKQEIKGKGHEHCWGGDHVRKIKRHGKQKEKFVFHQYQGLMEYKITDGRIN